VADPEHDAQQAAAAEPEANPRTGTTELAAKTDAAPDEWHCRFPSLADFNFNYCTLLKKANQTAMARAPSSAADLRIAVIGAGVAGLTVARELYRCGYQNIDIYEATDRIGGRTYSIPSPDGLTTFELGAMRLPFFWPYDENGRPSGIGRASGNCALSYYCETFDISTEPFPNPAAEGFTTGVYIHRGRGADRPNRWDEQPETRLIDPKDPGLKPIREKWERFEKLFKAECRTRYGTAEWPQFWAQIVKRYDPLTFREFVLLDAKEHYDPACPGDFGGLAMTREQARIFAFVGMGEGGWGAFYDISCLYVLRTALFGFFDGLQLIQGRFSDDCSRDIPESPCDSLGRPLAKPAFLGVQSLAECLFYIPATRHDDPLKSTSLYDAVEASRRTGKRQQGVHLFARNSVHQIRKREPNEGGGIHLVSQKVNGVYDHVVVSAQPWALQVEAGFENFEYETELPWEVRDAMDSSHFITSCKVFYPLKERYWEKPASQQTLKPIPQVIVTDTFIQGVYGMAVKVDGHDRGHPGVVLISYTWEDDAAKLIADDDKTLAKRCLEHLDSILKRCGHEPISTYLDTDAPRVHHWIRSESYRGCARLYRQYSQANDVALLGYNERCSKASRLYLAGEAYSVEGGWVEPALRSALDAVLHLIKNSEGTFLNGFDFERHYPSRFPRP
jgi:tryptophan 2-monooxygenase